MKVLFKEEYNIRLSEKEHIIIGLLQEGYSTLGECQEFDGLKVLTIKFYVGKEYCQEDETESIPIEVTEEMYEETKNLIGCIVKITYKNKLGGYIGCPQVITKIEKIDNKEIYKDYYLK